MWDIWETCLCSRRFRTCVCVCVLSLTLSLVPPSWEAKCFRITDKYFKENTCLCRWRPIHLSLMKLLNFSDYFCNHAKLQNNVKYLQVPFPKRFECGWNLRGGFCLSIVIFASFIERGKQGSVFAIHSFWVPLLPPEAKIKAIFRKTAEGIFLHLPGTVWLVLEEKFLDQVWLKVFFQLLGVQVGATSPMTDTWNRS